MIKSTLSVDLPSARMENESGPLAWIKGLFGKRRDVSGQEAITVGALQLLTAIAEAFRHAGLTNVISLLVDREAVYLDASDVPDDIDAMLRAAQAKSVADRGFRDMRLAFTQREQGLDVVVEVTIENEVVLGTEEMAVELSAHIEEFALLPGESVARYVERVRATVTSAARMETYRRDVHALSERLAEAIRGALPQATVTSAPAHFEVARPSAQELASLRELPIGVAQLLPRQYRPRPQERLEGGPVADAFALYFDDPYAALTRWVVVEAIARRGALSQRSVRVLRPDGVLEFRGDQAAERGARLELGALPF